MCVNLEVLLRIRAAAFCTLCNLTICDRSLFALINSALYHSLNGKECPWMNNGCSYFSDIDFLTLLISTQKWQNKFLHVKVTWADIDISESNWTPRLRTLGYALITELPICKEWHWILDIWWRDAIIKNSLLSSFNCNLYYKSSTVFISAMQASIARVLHVPHCPDQQDWMMCTTVYITHQNHKKCFLE